MHKIVIAIGFGESHDHELKYVPDRCFADVFFSLPILFQVLEYRLSDLIE